MKIIFLTLLISVFTSCRPSIDIDKDIFRPHMSAFGKEVRKTDQLYLSRDNTCTGDVERLEISFKTPKTPTIDEARRLYVDIVNRFIAITNNNEALRPYLTHYPLSIQDLNIKIYFSMLPNDLRPEHVNMMDMNYRVDSESNDHYIYYLQRASEDSTAVIFFKEKFEDAVEKLKLEASINQIKETTS